MRRSTGPADPIDAVLAALAAALPGSARSRGGLLQEAHDGLRDAAEAYERQGCSPAEAARRAAAEFGDPEDLAVDYADEALGLEARRASSVLAAGYLLVLAAWALLGRLTSHPEELSDHSWAASSFGFLGVFATLVAAGVVVTARRRALTAQIGSALARVTGTAGLLCGLATLAASYRVQPWGSGPSPGPTRSAWTTPVEVLSGLVVLVIIVLSVRCLTTARRAGRAQRSRRGLARRRGRTSGDPRGRSGPARRVRRGTSTTGAGRCGADGRDRRPRREPATGRAWTARTRC